jgi:hypothetical protein
MKYILACLLFIFSQTVLAADKFGNAAIWGAGQKSCFSYTTARKNGEENYYKDYLMGYLTAYNAQTPDTYRISGSENLDGILSWLDSYCTEKQVYGFDQAVVEFITEHYPKRQKSAPATGL